MHSRYTGPIRRPLFDVSSNGGGAPETAWDIAEQLIRNRQRGQVIERDPRAHEALRLLGGKLGGRAAYDEVESAPEQIRPSFLRVYGLLTAIASLMVELEEVIGGVAPAPECSSRDGPLTRASYAHAHARGDSIERLTDEQTREVAVDAQFPTAERQVGADDSVAQVAAPSEWVNGEHFDSPEVPAAAPPEKPQTPTEQPARVTLSDLLAKVASGPSAC